MVRFIFFAVVIFAVTVRKSSSNETLKNITASFLKLLEECRRELNVGENVLADMYHFWKQDRDLIHRDTGCTIVCMSQKLNILDTDGFLHHGNAHDFAVKHGAADETAQKLVTTVHECEKKHSAEEDKCVRALEVAKCFKAAMHEINWAPKMDVIISEVLTEI